MENQIQKGQSFVLDKDRRVLELTKIEFEKRIKLTIKLDLSISSDNVFRWLKWPNQNEMFLISFCLLKVNSFRVMFPF